MYSSSAQILVFFASGSNENNVCKPVGSGRLRLLFVQGVDEPEPEAGSAALAAGDSVVASTWRLGAPTASPIPIRGLSAAAISGKVIFGVAWKPSLFAASSSMATMPPATTDDRSPSVRAMASASSSSVIRRIHATASGSERYSTFTDIETCKEHNYIHVPVSNKQGTICHDKNVTSCTV